MAEPLFDDRTRALRRHRALTREPRPFLAERIVEEWLERLAPVQRSWGAALVTGCPPALRKRLAGVADGVTFADSLDAVAEVAEGSLDLLLVLGEIDGRDHLPQLLAIAASRLAPGGLLAGAFPGGHGLPALRAALHAADQASGRFAPRSHPRIEAGAFAQLLGQAGLSEPVVDIDRVRLRYRSLERLVGDLRDHAGTNQLLARPRQGLTRTQWNAARTAFADQAEDGATSETIELIHYSAWANSRLTAWQESSR